MASKPLKLVYVEWVDSATIHGWHDIEELQDDGGTVFMQSVGWIIHETKEALMLAAHLHKDIPENGAVRMAADAIAIPKVAIRVRRALNGAP